MAKRTVYKKKSTAKNARKKGQSVYKVKKGYSISKKRKGLVLATMLLWIIAMFAVMFAVTGCTAEQVDGIDGVVSSVGTALDVAGQTLASPVGQYIPEPAKSGIGFLLAAAGGILAFWRDNKYRVVKKVNKAVVQAVENNPINTDLKKQVAKNLAIAGVTEKGKQIINKAKN